MEIKYHYYENAFGYIVYSQVLAPILHGIHFNFLSPEKRKTIEDLKTLKYLYIYNILVYVHYKILFWYFIIFFFRKYTIFLSLLGYGYPKMYF